ncbi:MAG: DUF937 domain-containing protein [Burkholderiaceae bacterium]
MNQNSLSDEFLAQLQGDPLRDISAQLGTTPQQANEAIGAALPLLLGALGRNAAEPQGAQALFGALDRDHGGMDLGSVLGGVLGSLGGQGGGAMGAGGLGDVLGGLLGGGGAAAGSSAFGGRQGNLDGLLGHIFGGQQQRAETGLGQATGLGSGGAQTLLKVLAPLLMAFLAQRFTQGSGSSRAGSAPGPDDLSQALGEERSRIGQQGGLGGGLMTAVLDQNGDGQVDLSDLLKLGGALLGGRR